MKSVTSPFTPGSEYVMMKSWPPKPVTLGPGSARFVFRTAAPQLESGPELR